MYLFCFTLLNIIIVGHNCISDLSDISSKLKSIWNPEPSPTLLKYFINYNINDHNNNNKIFSSHKMSSQYPFLNNYRFHRQNNPDSSQLSMKLSLVNDKLDLINNNIKKVTSNMILFEDQIAWFANSIHNIME